MSTPNTKLAIFPASGGLGTATLTHLLRTQKAEPQDVVLIARSPQRLAEFKKEGVDVRKADFDQPESLEHAFDGVKVLNLISYASIQNDHRFEAHKLAIDAARASGVSQIIYSSLAFAGPPTSTTSVTQVMSAHLRTEAYLASLHAANPDSFSYSILRQGLYSESFDVYTFDLNSPPADGKIRIPHDGSGPGVAWAKRDELGEATAKVLLSAFKGDPSASPFVNTTSLLSGPRAYTLAETATILGRVIKKDVSIEQVSLEEYASQPALEGAGHFQAKDSEASTPKEWALKWTTAWEGIRRGETAVVTETLEELLGRKPEAFEVTVRGMVGA